MALIIVSLRIQKKKKKELMKNGNDAVLTTVEPSPFYNVEIPVPQNGYASCIDICMNDPSHPTLLILSC